MQVGKLLASWRRNFHVATHVAHADTVLRGLSATADCVEAAPSSIGWDALSCDGVLQPRYGWFPLLSLVKQFLNNCMTLN
jgi:hypothetical protein